MLQAEDGIRDLTVTGVQTCALPISAGVPRRGDGPPRTGATGGILEPDGPARNRPRARRAARSPPRHRIAARPRPARGRSLGTADAGPGYRDRKSTRLNSSHSQISYAVFCLKKKKIYTPQYL